MEEGIYVPMSDRTLRKLDQLVSITGLSEEALLSMALTNLLACVRQAENDNTDDIFELPAVALPPEALSSDALAGSRSALGVSNSEMPTG